MRCPPTRALTPQPQHRRRHISLASGPAPSGRGRKCRKSCVCVIYFAAFVILFAPFRSPPQLPALRLCPRKKDKLNVLQQCERKAKLQLAIVPLPGRFSGTKQQQPLFLVPMCVLVAQKKVFIALRGEQIIKIREDNKLCNAVWLLIRAKRSAYGALLMRLHDFLAKSVLDEGARRG